MNAEDAILCRGIWLPPGEGHLRDMIENHSKVGDIDGRGTYQYHKLDQAMKYVPRFRVAVDVGAHVGLWSMHLVKKFEHVHAFEPIPLHRELFRRNVADTNVSLWSTALGDVAGTELIKLMPGNSGCTHIGPDGDYLIEVETLDSYSLADVDFIKIDVEGYELEAVKGARETIERCRPVMVVEQKGNDAKHRGHPRDEAAAYLHGLGYTSAKILSGDHILIPNE